MIKMNTPLFVKVERYKEISNNMKQVEEKLQNAERTLKMLKDIKQKEEEQFDEWEHELHLLKEKLKTLNQTINGA